MIASAWQSDNGNGTFTNPVLYADYPDPDIIRVGADFYMVSTTFVNSPGINLLKSQDMVNWELVAQIASTVDGGNSFNMVGGTAYEQGYWAPSIRHHNGTFYVAVQPTFTNGRIYHATNPAGPWSFHQLDRNIYDPGLFIDTNGTGYIVCGHGPQNLMTLNAAFSQIVSEQNNFLDSGGEGSHMVKRGSYYYVFNAKPSVWPFELRCSRTTSLNNPVWETRVALTATTGGHQGAIVDIDSNGNWFGFVHQDSGAVGRMPRIGPVFWENNWPIFGTPANRDVIAATGTKPVQGMPLKQPATSDDFSAATLGLQWAWNHNPDNTRWSLTQRPGYLRLRPTLASGFWTARNTLTQKAQGPRSQGVVKLDLTNLQSGDIAGFGTLGKINGHIAVNTAAGGARTLSMHVIKDKIGSYTAATGVPVTGNTLYLRTDLDFVRNLGICSYSADGMTWTTLGGNFPLMFGYGSTFQGEQFAMFCYNPSTASSAGYVEVDSFNFTTLDDNTDLVKTQRGRPKLNAARSTFVADNGQLLRGPYESTEWTTAAPQSEVAKMKDLGFNAVHLYAEVFNPTYPATTNNTPGYAVAEVDKMVTMTRDLGLYLVMTIGNGANNGNHNFQWAVDFWNFYALRYKDETHVVFEIHNEPMAWGPSYLTGTTPAGALDMEVAAYNAIRTHAPHTPVLLMSYAVLGGNGGTNAALTDILEFNRRVFGNQNAVWTNEAVGFHGYAGWEGTATAVAGLIAAGYPCFMTEFGWHDWGTTGGTALEVELTTDLERLGVSWLTFQYIPPSGVSADVTIPGLFKDPVDAAGLSWTPDFGTWPVARAPFGNGGQPRATVANWVNNFLTGTVRIQAEDFDSGGEGVACHDSDAGNTGGQYRLGEVVDITTCNDTGGGHKVGWTTDGEWLEYTILVKEPGYYQLALRYATPNSGCAIEVISNVEDTTGPRTLASTGANTNWATATLQVYLEYGRQKIRLEIPKGGFDLNWFELSPASTGIIANGNYKLLNAASTLSMEGVAATNTVTASAYTGSTFQQWNLQHMGGGQYKITSVGNGSSWNAAGGSLGLVSNWNNSNDRCFVILPAGGGYLRFLCVGSGLSLAPAAAAMEQQEYTAAASQKWGILAPSAPQFPGGLTATPTSPTHVGLTWNAVAGATSYNVRRSTTSGGPYVTIATGLVATNFTDTVAATTGYYYVVSAVIGGMESLNSAEAGLLLPYPWLSQDIGNVGVSGSVEFQNGVFAQDASGGDIWGTTDAFRFTYLATSGDCTITARVTNLENTDPWAKAGVMIRESLVPNSRNTFMFVSPGNGVGWQTRTSAGGNTSNAVTAGLTAPCWVRLVRSGNTFTGYYSTNGKTWTQRGTTTLAMSTNVFIGLALTSHNNSTLCTAGFDNVTAPNWSFGDPPVAPTGLAATGGNAAINLAWNSTPAATSYTIKRSAISGTGFTILASGQIGTTFADTTVPAGQTYHYVVSATGYGGTGPDSAQASATAMPSDAWLKFDEGSGVTAADSTGNNWIGTLVNGPTWLAGHDDGAVQLDGTDDHVTLPAGVASGLGNFTIAAWVKLDALGNWSRVFDFGTGTDNYMFLTPRVGTNGNVRFAIRTPSQPEQIINGTAPLPIGTWTHVAVTRSGTLATLYVNGAAVGSNTINLAPADLGRTTQNYLGRSQWAGDSYLDGQLDDFRILASALSASDVAALAAGPPVITSSTVANGGIGSLFNYQIIASNSPTGYAATGLPEGLDVNETNGLITGTPAVTGNFNVGLSAANFAGNGGATLVLTIVSPPFTEEEMHAPQMEMIGGNVHLTVQASVIGHLYRLQYCDDIATGPWLNHGAAQPGTGGELDFMIPDESNVPRRFYRVHIQR